MSETGDFAEFLRSAERRLVSYLHYATGGSTDVEDLFQDVSLAVYRNWRKVRRLDRPVAWAIRVARNLVINRAKRATVERRALDRERETLAPPTLAPSTDETHSLELSETIHTSLAALPEDQRQAVCMKIWGGLTWVEIGKSLGVSDDTAARAFARGLRALAPALKDFAP